MSEFVYRYNGTERAHIVISFILDTQTPQNDRESEINSVLAALKARDMHAEDISGNELAKSHVRYLVGGKVAVPDERLFSFGMPVLFMNYWYPFVDESN